MNRISSFLKASLVTVMLISSCSSDGDDNPGDDPGTTPVEETSDVDLYVTTASQSMLFKKVDLNFNTKDNMSPYTITLDPGTKYQEMDGFGAAVTGSTCYNLLKMSQENRTALLKEIFDPTDGMGYSYIRVPIGCSDFSLSEYTWCDTEGIENFAVPSEDEAYVFPVLKEIRAINPNIKIMGSPWTAPRWMKVNNLTDLDPYPSWTGGQLNPAYYNDYARYFVWYIQDMEQAGFPIESMTIQNEPLNRGNSASMYMTWQEQRDFIKNSLGPAFQKNGITTKIIVYDHNYDYDGGGDQMNYPANIYADADASQYVDGSAFHAYGGDVSEMENVHDAYPSKGLYFTEISIGDWGYTFSSDLMWNMREVCLGTINRYGKAVIVWNLLLDDQHGPDRPGGCNTCYGVIDISSANYSSMTRNSHYYTIGHLSKVIEPGAYRIATEGYTDSSLYYSAFLNPDGSYAFVAQNDTDEEKSITLSDGTHTFSYKLPARSVASFRWQ